MMNSRWQANKIGLINFWYYDEQEFPFVKGRMLLRGSNGSGKSVTMQSVVPLLLDGNMSPERLDPFGSRDRKMSSYLLEEDDGREERTGEYLLYNVFQIFQARFFMIYEDYIHAAFSFRLFVNWGSEGIPKMPCPHSSAIRAGLFFCVFLFRLGEPGACRQ